MAFHKAASVPEIDEEGKETGSEAYSFVVDDRGSLRIEQKKISLSRPLCSVEDALAALHHLYGGPTSG